MELGIKLPLVEDGGHVSMRPEMTNFYQYGHSDLSAASAVPPWGGGGIPSISPMDNTALSI